MNRCLAIATVKGCVQFKLVCARHLHVVRQNIAKPNFSRNITEQESESARNLIQAPRCSYSRGGLSTYHFAAMALFSHSNVSHPQARRDIGLELFHHVDTLLATCANSQEDQQCLSTEASNLASNEESSRVRSLVDSVVQKLLQFPAFGNNAAVQGKGSRRLLNKSPKLNHSYRMD